MNVLHFSESPLSNAPLNLVKVLNKSEHIKANLVLTNYYYHAFSPIHYPYDILGGNQNKEQIMDLAKKADVIHFHNYLLQNNTIKFNPNLLAILKNKPWVYQVHTAKEIITSYLTSGKNKRFGNISYTFNNPNIKEKLVVAQFQARQFPDFTVVPNVVDIEEDIFKENLNKPSTIKIGYSPSNTTLGGWSNKGFKETQDSLTRIKSKFRDHVEIEIITKSPYLECLNKKKDCSILIDEVMTGSYHMCSLEGLAFGAAVINNVDELCVKALENFIGTKLVNNPFVKTNIDGLESTLEGLILNPEKLKKIQKDSRQFMEDNWNNDRINRHFFEIYKRALS